MYFSFFTHKSGFKYKKVATNRHWYRYKLFEFVQQQYIYKININSTCYVDQGDIQDVMRNILFILHTLVADIIALFEKEILFK